ncbi:hypothetical protein [Enterobacter kobei]|uniref:hypothetical protein n=1 Tax=Enterobacter kobei TaxID=208224 RepID=UPI00298CAF6A|nr:hypothetical protein [Enterobacter kobei]
MPKKAASIAQIHTFVGDILNLKKAKNVSGVTLPVSQLSDANVINTVEREVAKYIEYFIAANCYAPSFRIR